MPVIVIFYLLLKGFTYADTGFEPGTETLASISHSLSGCFSSYSEQMILYRADTTCFVTLLSRDKKSRTITLTKEQVTGIYSFIEECKNRQAAIGQCTTVETYRIQAGEQRFTLTDGTCNWRGFTGLIKLLLPLEGQN